MAPDRRDLSVEKPTSNPIALPKEMQTAIAVFTYARPCVPCKRSVLTPIRTNLSSVARKVVTLRDSYGRGLWQ